MARHHNAVVKVKLIDNRKFFGINKVNHMACLYPMMQYICVVIFLLSACHSQEVKVKALRDVHGYDSTDAAYSLVDFVIPKGSVCFLGNEKYGKTDRFVEIRCENGLTGLIIEDEAFMPLDE